MTTLRVLLFMHLLDSYQDLDTHIACGFLVERPSQFSEFMLEFESSGAWANRGQTVESIAFPEAYLAFVPDL